MRPSALGSAVLLALLVAAGAPSAAQAQSPFVPALGSPFPLTDGGAPLAVVDADRDGILDAASGRLALLRGNGTGRLSAPQTIGVTAALDDLAAGQLGGDPLPDFAAIEQGSPDRLATFVGQAGAPYLASVASSDVGDAEALAIGDVDGDGNSDIAVVGEAPSTLRLLRGSSTGTFSQEDHSLGSEDLVSLVLADFTGDGRLDLAAGTAAGDVQMALGDPAGGFVVAPGSPYPTGTADPVTALAAADFDSDGRLDLAVPRGGEVILLRGDGLGGLAPLGPPRPAVTGGTVQSVATGDVNADGMADLALGGSTGYVSVLLGDGRGLLAPLGGSPLWSGAHSPVEAVHLADLNRDGQLDVVTAGDGRIAALLNAHTGLMQAAPQAVGFGTVLAGGAEAVQRVSFQSARGRLAISRVAVEHARGVYSVAPNGCLRRVLLVGRSCTVTIRMRPPRKAGEAQALLTVDANAAAVVVPLTTTVRGPIVRAAVVRPATAAVGRRPLLRYRVSEAARVRIDLERRIDGRRVGRGCVLPRPGILRRPRCRTWVAVVSLSRAASAGLNLQRLPARVSRQLLAPGWYRARVSAADRFRNRSRERIAKYRIKPAAKRKPTRRRAQMPSQASRGAK